MSRIICIGHAALDRLYRIEAFPPMPTKVRAIEHIESGGGMAANASATIARLGGKVELWSRIGEDDAGVKIRTGLKAYGVDARYVQMFDEVRSSTSAIIVDDAGERLIVGNRDTSMPSGTSWLPLERISKASAVLADVRWLEGLRAAFTQARSCGVATVLDAAAALVRVREMGPRHAGVTLGARGYLWDDGAGPRQIPGFKVDVVDTTGAGDAFHGAFTLALVEGHETSVCARFACAAAAMKCTRLGSRAGLPKRRELEAFLSANPEPRATA